MDQVTQDAIIEGLSRKGWTGLTSPDHPAIVASSGVVTLAVALPATEEALEVLEAAFGLADEVEVESEEPIPA